MFLTRYFLFLLLWFSQRDVRSLRQENEFNELIWINLTFCLFTKWDEKEKPEKEKDDKCCYHCVECFHVSSFVIRTSCYWCCWCCWKTRVTFLVVDPLSCFFLVQHFFLSGVERSHVETTLCSQFLATTRDTKYWPRLVIQTEVRKWRFLCFVTRNLKQSGWDMGWKNKQQKEWSVRQTASLLDSCYCQSFYESPVSVSSLPGKTSVERVRFCFHHHHHQVIPRLDFLIRKESWVKGTRIL